MCDRAICVCLSVCVCVCVCVCDRVMYVSVSECVTQRSVSVSVCVSEYVCRGLMDRALDLKPEVTQGCGFESWLWQEVSTTEVRPLSKAPNPRLLPGRCTVGCPLLHLDGLNAENTFHCSLYSV